MTRHSIGNKENYIRKLVGEEIRTMVADLQAPSLVALVRFQGTNDKRRDVNKSDRLPRLMRGYFRGPLRASAHETRLRGVLSALDTPVETW